MMLPSKSHSNEVPARFWHIVGLSGVVSKYPSSRMTFFVAEEKMRKEEKRNICVQLFFTAPSMSASNRFQMPRCRSQPMPSFVSPMRQSVGRIYGPTGGWNPFNQGDGWAMNGWALLKMWDRR